MVLCSHESTFADSLGDLTWLLLCFHVKHLLGTLLQYIKTHVHVFLLSAIITFPWAKKCELTDNLTYFPI